MTKKSAFRVLLFGAVVCVIAACVKLDVKKKSTTSTGFTWTQATSLSSVNVSQLAVSGSTIFAATSSGLYSSTNNGSAWTAVAGGLPSSSSASNVAVSGSNIYAATNSGLYYSTNSGTSWTATTSSTVVLVTALAASGSNLYAGVGTNGIYLSTDNGSNWTAINSGLPSNGSILSITVSGSSLLAGVVVENGNGGAPGSAIYLSTNNGTSWLALETRFPQIADLNCMAVSGNTVFAGITGYTNADVSSGSGIYMSSDNGNNWAPVSGSGLPVYPFNALSLAISGNNIFAGYDFDGVYHSTDNGSTWTAVGDDSTNNLTVGAMVVVGNTIIIGDGFDSRGIFTASFQ